MMRLRSILVACVVIVVLGLAARFVGIDPLALLNVKISETPPPAEVTPEPEVVAVIDEVDLDKPIEDGGFKLADQFTGTIQNPDSLEELRQAINGRLESGLTVLNGQLDQVTLGPDSETDELLVARNLYEQYGTLALYAGRFEEATVSFERALELATFMDALTKEMVGLQALLGVVALRRGEVDNNLGRDKPLSHRFPIPVAGVQTIKDGYREAIRRFREGLKGAPDDLRMRWLLNIAHMKAGDYPARVAPEFLIAVEKPVNDPSAPIRFDDISRRLGLQESGPNLGGVAFFDDFTGDHLPDLLLGTLNTDFGMSFFVNKSSALFEDTTGTVGLDTQIYIKNGAAADFDNDGFLDLFLTRGGGEAPLRPTLLKNLGNGTFRDDTRLRGMIEPISSEAAAWGDFNNDGYLDLFVAGETRPPNDESKGKSRPDPRNFCRLYENLKDGTFREVAREAGVENLECARGAAWGDVDSDGDLDLFVANSNAPSRLYRNNGDGKFEDATVELGIIGPIQATSCWFWDFDNDGRLDLFVNDAVGTFSEMVESRVPGAPPSPQRAFLYRNLGEEGFVEIAADVGLDRIKLPLGCNFADIDNDGFLDIFVSQGINAVESFVPSLLLRNVEGGRFEDVSVASGASLLPKSHSVSFADYDADGDLDLFLQCGGIVPGDQAYNLLLQNNATRKASLQIRLVGTKTNRSALGTRIKATYTTSAGERRTIDRTVGNNSCYGGNSLVQSLGLLDAKQVDQIEIQWLGANTTQEFKNIAANQRIEITEGSERIKPLLRWSLSEVKP